MTQPFFSILVPVYNASKYLDECLESLTKQSFLDYEVVLVDDGSKDGSGCMCDAWQARFPERIRVFHQENQGVTMSRVRLFREARGRFLVSADADDVLHRDALRILHDSIARSDADMVLFRASKNRDFSTPICELPFRDGQLLSVSSSEELRRLLGSTFKLNALWAKTFRRELVCGDTDDSSICHIFEGEDLLFSLAAAVRAERIVFCDHILYYYRENPGSITKSFQPDLFRSIRDTLRIQRSYAEKWDSTGAMAKECDRNALAAFYGVIVRTCNSGLPLSEKRKHLLEVVCDGDFLRCFPQLSSIEERKKRYTLALANRKCFFPLYLYGWLRHIGILPASGKP